MTLTPEQRAETAEARVASLRVLTTRDNLLVREIYASIQGESTHAGEPCVFVRTTGCHLRCSYCDTAHAFHQGREATIEQVLAIVNAQRIPLVEVTGGEPLLQPAVPALLARLCDAGHTVLLETSGAVSTRAVDPRVHVILDVKTPSSGEAARNVWSNIPQMRPHDELKFVIGDEPDYDFAKQIIDKHPVPPGVVVLFSPSHPQMPPHVLAEWIVRDRLRVRFQIQMHKVLWGERDGV